MNHQYIPSPDTLPAHVTGFFRLNPGEELTVSDIAEKFGVRAPAGIHSGLARAVQAELLVREKDADDDWVYRAGPNLPALVDAAAQKVQRRPGGKSAVAVESDMDAMTICDDPLPAGRASPGAKYAPLFSKLRPGQCIKCKPDDVARLGNALRKYLEQNKLPFIMRTVRQYHTDGQGRVWMLEKPAEGAATLKRAA